jgi:hypothetical protein
MHPYLIYECCKTAWIILHGMQSIGYGHWYQDEPFFTS